ncbi:MAG TPA: hypothetical protein VF941_14305 [Clostridia bacterium]
MAIARDSHTFKGQTLGTPVTWSHTCTGSNLALFVGIRNQSSNSDDVTSVTYNGVAMTLIPGGKINNNGAYVYLYYLFAPATGTNTVSVSTSNAADTVTGFSVSYTGVKQSGMPDASNTATSATSSISASLTTVANNCWYIAIEGNNQNTISSTGGGLTLLDQTGGAGSADSNGSVAIGTYSPSFTLGGTSSSAMVVASFAPAPVVVSGGFFLAAQ